MRDIHDHPAHQEYKSASTTFKETIDTTHSDHWIDWLEGVSAKDIYIANKYLTSEPSDYSKTRIPALKVKVDDEEILITANNKKAELLAKAFFPPLPTHELFPPDTH